MWEDADHYRLRPGAERFSEFEVPVAAHLGLGVAIDHALALGIDAIAERVGVLGERLRGDLGAIEGVEIHDGGTRRSGIVTFTSVHAPPVGVAAAARAAGINVSVSEAPWARLDMVGPEPGVGGAGITPLLQHRGGARSAGGGRGFHDGELSSGPGTAGVVTTACPGSPVRRDDVFSETATGAEHVVGRLLARSDRPFHVAVPHRRAFGPGPVDGPTGSVSAAPKSPHTPGVKWAP